MIAVELTATQTKVVVALLNAAAKDYAAAANRFGILTAKSRRKNAMRAKMIRSIVAQFNGG